MDIENFDHKGTLNVKRNINEKWNKFWQNVTSTRNVPILTQKLTISIKRKATTKF